MGQSASKFYQVVEKKEWLIAVRDGKDFAKNKFSEVNDNKNINPCLIFCLDGYWIVSAHQKAPIILDYISKLNQIDWFDLV